MPKQTNSSRRFVIPLLAFALLTTGCYHAVVRAGPRSMMESETRTGWSLFWGITDATFDLADCPYGIAQATVWDPWWGFLPELITVGIASPKRLEYVCATSTPMPVYAPQPMQQQAPPMQAPPPRPPPQQAPPPGH